MLQPASQNVLYTIDHNHVFLISGRSVDTIGIELTNLFSKLFMVFLFLLQMPQMVFGVHFVPQPGKAYLNPTFKPEKISSIIQDFIIWVKIAARKVDL